MTATTVPSLPAASDPAPARVLRLHADVRRAAELIAPVWPLDRFVAVNPLGGLTHLPFEAACAEARRWRGVRTHLPLATARGLARSAGVGSSELRAALAEHAPAVLTAADVVVGDRTLSPLALVLADLEHGPNTPMAAPLRTLGARASDPVPAVRRAAIDELVAAWCATFVDDHTATWAMSGREEGLHRAWRRVLPHDPRARRILGRRAVAWLGQLPLDPADALDTALRVVGIADDDRVDELRVQLAQLPGWAGHARWHDEWAPVDHPDPRLRLLDLAAVRTTLEVAALLHPDRGAAREPLGLTVPPAREDPAADAAEALLAASLTNRAEAVCARLDLPTDASVVDRVREALVPLAGWAREAVWQVAHEQRWRDRLLAQLADPAAGSPAVAGPPTAGTDPAVGREPAAGPGPASPGAASAQRPVAQVLCCIDVRSEGLRRHLEATRSYETFGVAGFFGIPVAWQPFGSPLAEPRNPVLLTPANRATEVPAADAREQADRVLALRRRHAAAEDATHGASHGVGSPFAYAEAAGWFTGPAALTRTLRRRRGSAPRATATQPATVPVVDGDGGFDLAQRTLLAESLLRVVGLTDGFARLVVLCGHGARTRNNPHAASLDCGACGGAPGGTSARLAAAILNDPGVRRELVARDITIPVETWFVAAEHDTVADVVTLLDTGQVPRAWQAELTVVTADLEVAGAALAAERAASQPGLDAGLRLRGDDWAQVRPEWGLAGNAAFIVAPRAATIGLDLQRRVFLHSYRAEADPEGRALEVILTAPLIVAQWINSQYHFSTVDPERLGAGDKLLHNVVAGVGVTLGDGGDLRVGLPTQSVALGGHPVHEPLRLLAVVEAPLTRTAEIVQRHRDLRHLVEHGWITLVGREGPTAPWYRLRPEGRWEPWRWASAGGAPDTEQAA